MSKKAKFKVGQVVCIKRRKWYGRIYKIFLYPKQRFDLLYLEHDGTEGWNIYSSNVRPLTKRERGVNRQKEQEK
jgi:hypothetical protein